jgi:hypothetical protein
MIIRGSGDYVKEKNMTDLAKIRKLEGEEADRVQQEREKARERISRAEADASFRVGEAQKETKEIIDEITGRGREDASKEMQFIKEENTEKNKKLLEEESERIDRAVEFIMGKLQ